VPAQSGKTQCMIANIDSVGSLKVILGTVPRGKAMSELTDGVAVNVKLIKLCSTQSFKVHPKLFVLGHRSGVGCGIDDCR